MPPETTPKKRVLMLTNRGPKSRRKKMKNFSPSEDQALCKAYVNVTSDSQLGTGQKAMQFWYKVKAAFEDLLVHVDDDIVESSKMAVTFH
jgi:hypothetical protein